MENIVTSGHCFSENSTSTISEGMTLPLEQCALLKRHGFKWVKDKSTDRVDAEDIADVRPSEGGFTVFYTDESVLRSSKATVSKIDFPDDPDSQWIMVHWVEIEDKIRT